MAWVLATASIAQGAVTAHRKPTVATAPIAPIAPTAHNMHVRNAVVRQNIPKKEEKICIRRQCLDYTSEPRMCELCYCVKKGIFRKCKKWAHKLVPCPKMTCTRFGECEEYVYP